jgi:hypothetical protein
LADVVGAGAQETTLLLAEMHPAKLIAPVAGTRSNSAIASSPEAVV